MDISTATSAKSAGTEVASTRTTQQQQPMRIPCCASWVSSCEQGQPLKMIQALPPRLGFHLLRFACLKQ